MEEAKWILKKFYPNAHISSDKQLCEDSGVNYCTFRKRMSHPDTLRLYELEALNGVLQMDDEGLLTFIKCIITPKQSGRGRKKTT